MRYFVFLILLLQFNFGHSQTEKDKTISLDPYLSIENYEHFRRFSLSSPDSYVDFIEGFEFDWGYKYVLSIKVTELDSELSDGTQYNYSLNRIIAKTKVPDSTIFRMTLNGNRYYYELPPEEQYMNATLKQLNDSTYMYFEKVEIEVPEEFRANFQKVVEGEFWKLAQFQFVSEKRVRLIRL